EGTVFVNGIALKRPMTNGTRVVVLPPGTYKIQIKQDGYQDSPEQVVQIKPGDTNTKPLAFALAAIPQLSTLMIQSAPAGADVVIDGQPAGTTDSSGGFSKQINPGSHSIALRKDGFDELNVSREFKAGESGTLSGEAMKSYGTVAFKVSPDAARLTY